MEFSVSLFANRLFDYLLDARDFPFYKNEENKQTDESKHSKRNPTHLKQAISEQKMIVGDEKTMTFDIGSEGLELSHPYYHILQQAPVIRKRGKGTTKTKGSQAMFEPKNRDYEIVSWNGKTFSKEYSRNVRGMRKSKTASHWNKNHTKFENKESNSYVNKHYRYFDKILDNEVVNRLALEFGLKPARKMDTGLLEEYSMQEDANFDNVLAMLNSHNIGE